MNRENCNIVTLARTNCVGVQCMNKKAKCFPSQFTCRQAREDSLCAKIHAWALQTGFNFPIIRCGIKLWEMLIQH